MPVHRLKYKRFLLPPIIFSMILVFAGCGGKTGIREYKEVSEKKDESARMEYSPDSIDNAGSYEVYFRLEKPVDCVRIGITSTYVPDSFSGKKEHLMTYFVLDQLIDLSHFRNAEKKYEISEIGRNFDDGWNRKRYLTVCTGRKFPLLKLDDKTIYRLRFTTFRDTGFEFNISINADTKVFYIGKPDL